MSILAFENYLLMLLDVTADRTYIGLFQSPTRNRKKQAEQMIMTYGLSVPWSWNLHLGDLDTTLGQTVNYRF